jgi:hypothetical protein
VTTWTAAISNETTDGRMDVCVIVNDQEWDGSGYKAALSDRMAADPVSLPVETTDELCWDKAEDAAVPVLADLGWVVPRWDVQAGNAEYGPAVPVPGNPLYGEWDPDEDGAR